VVTLPNISTIADGVAVKTPGDLVFPYIQKNIDSIITINDDELVDAFLDLMEKHKMIVENAGLLTVAALKHLDCKDKNVVSVLSGALSVAREAVSGYQLFGANHVAAGEWIEENTDRDSVFMTGQQHINPVCSLAGRQIICGSDLYVFFHGLNYGEQAYDCRKFYENPADHSSVIEKYGVDYIYISSYERSANWFSLNEAALEELFPLLYESYGGEHRIFAVPEEMKQ
jgi:uncharacterized membrane protein